MIYPKNQEMVMTIVDKSYVSQSVYKLDLSLKEGISDS